MSLLEEKVIDSRYLFEGKVVVLRQDTIQNARGDFFKREIIEHDPAVVIVPFQAPNTFYLIRQYRRATKQILWEIPAGIMDKGEDPLDAAKRELREETGLLAAHWEPLVEGYPSPGFCDEYMYFYLAKDLTQGLTELDEDEDIEVVPHTMEEVEQKIKSKEIVDLKTILGWSLLKAKGGLS